MRSAWLWCLVLCVAVAARTAAPAAVEITAEPHHHLVLKNQVVRVFAVEVPPQASTLMHRHRSDYLFVTLGDSAIRSERRGEKPAELRLKDGDVRFTKGGFAHIAANLADTPFRNVTIEVLKPSRGIVRLATCDIDEGIECGFCDISPAGQQKCEWPGASDTVPELEKKEPGYGVYQFVTHLQPGSTTGMHTHTVDHLLVAVSDLELKNEVQGKPAEEIQMKSGEVRWVKGGFTHSLTNVGKQPAWWVSFEFK